VGLLCGGGWRGEALGGWGVWVGMVVQNHRQVTPLAAMMPGWYFPTGAWILNYPLLDQVTGAVLPAAQVFYRAEVNEEVLFSEMYGRARTRISYYALVMYSLGGVDVQYVAKIRYFVKLPSSVFEDEVGQFRAIPALRLAVVAMRKAKRDGRLFVTDDRKKGPSDFWKNYAMPPDALKGRLEKVVLAVSKKEPFMKYFATYCHITDR